MALEITMPKFGLTMLEGTIQQWHKTEGASVSAGDIICEVETEKVLYEVEAPAAGVIANILYPEAATVPVATVMAVIAEAGEDAAQVAARYTRAVPESGGALAATISTPARRVSSESPRAAAARDAPVASPAARKLAKEHNVDLGAIALGGRGGRITRADVHGIRYSSLVGEDHEAARLELCDQRALICAPSNQHQPGPPLTASEHHGLHSPSGDEALGPVFLSALTQFNLQPQGVQQTLSIASRSLDIFAGGKGANQSVALARAGAEVSHAGRVGDDGR